jgi:hypothetical protein
MSLVVAQILGHVIGTTIGTWIAVRFIWGQP